MGCHRKTICELALEFAPPLLLKKLGEVKITVEQVMT
jgi:hypothetical protein